MLIVLMAALCAGLAHAAEEEADGFEGFAGLGFAATSGNSENTTVNGNLRLSYRLGIWRHEATAAAFGATSTDPDTEEDQTTAERYQAGYKIERKLNEYSYLFGRLNYDKDRFSGYDRQLSETIGYGRRVFERPRHALDLESGIGARQSDLSDGTSQSEMIVRLAGVYAWTLSDTTAFRQTLATEIGADNTTTEWMSELKARLVNNIALALAYTIRNNTDVPPGSEKTDTFTTLNLQYEF